MTTKIEAKHTPGPWLVMGNQRNGHFDYVLPTSQNEEFQANCRLIAAAPELLRELKTRHASCECQNIAENNDCTTYLAIAKAEGR